MNMSAENPEITTARTEGDQTPAPIRDYNPRDLVILPLISLVTVLLMLGSAELVARLVWPKAAEDACLSPDSVTGHRFRANCSSVTKTPEGPWVTNRYNDCGYRTKESCRSKAAGTLRVAVLGTSFSYGYATPYESAYTTIAGRDLSRLCSHPVEFQNVAAPEYDLIDVYHRFPEALALKPDLILLGLTEVDLKSIVDPQRLAHRDDLVASAKQANAATRKTGLKRFVESVKSSRALEMLQHFMYQDPKSYLDLYLLYGDNADYLRPPFSRQWQQRFTDADLLIGDMAGKAQSAGIPFALMAGVQASQVALISKPRAGVEPTAFGTALEKIAAHHNLLFIDPLKALAQHGPHPIALFYVVDGHIGPEGQAVLASVVERVLLTDSGGPFGSCSVPGGRTSRYLAASNHE